LSFSQNGIFGFSASVFSYGSGRNVTLEAILHSAVASFFEEVKKMESEVCVNVILSFS
jgi:hypothetical protein